MACIACEGFAKRITNIFRDDELKIKYTELTNCEIKIDCFICDSCNDKLETAYTFRSQCVEIYRKSNPIEETVIETFTEDQDTKHQVESSSCFILADEDETLIAQEAGSEHYATSIEEKTFNEVEQEQEYEGVFYEFEEPNEQLVEEEQFAAVKTKPRKSEERGILNRKSYTVEQKLRIIEYAELNNNRTAARHFEMNESSVRCFRRQKNILIKMNPEKKTNRKAYPHWPVLEEELKEFVENYPNEHGVKAKLKDIKQEAITIAERRGIANFNGSNSYIFKFMQRHQLPTASPRPRKRVKLENEDETSSKPKS